MTAVLPEYDPVTVDPVVLSIDGPDLLTDGWAARLVPTGPVPTHTRSCTLAAYEVPAEACACADPLDQLRQRHAEHLRHHPH